MTSCRFLFSATRLTCLLTLALVLNGCRARRPRVIEQGDSVTINDQILGEYGRGVVHIDLSDTTGQTIWELRAAERAVIGNVTFRLGPNPNRLPNTAFVTVRPKGAETFELKRGELYLYRVWDAGSALEGKPEAVAVFGFKPPDR